MTHLTGLHALLFMFPTNTSNWSDMLGIAFRSPLPQHVVAEKNREPIGALKFIMYIFVDKLQFLILQNVGRSSLRPKLEFLLQGAN
jgi:hypothetical protein